MTTAPKPAAPDFDLIARPYRWLEYLSFGPALARCRNHFLPQLADRRAALVLGDGDGRFLARLLAANPRLHADAVDLSPAMLGLLTRRAPATHTAARLRTHHADALTFTPVGPYDLIVTHFFLDCLAQSELDTLCTRIAPCLAPNALWLVSDFRIPPGPFSLPARALVRSLYFAFRALTGLRTTRLPDHAAALRPAGFTRIAQHLSLAGVLTTELWAYTAAALPEYTRFNAPAAATSPQRPRPGPGPRSRAAQPLAARARPRRLSS
ncbi:MAG: class I SAM-dependent methyltransferase [Acidobacteriaceae bacterium]|jgi:SAM-dependent methyltransferase